MRFTPKPTVDPSGACEQVPILVEESRFYGFCGPGRIFLSAESVHLLPSEARRVANALIREAEKIEKARSK